MENSTKLIDSDVTTPPAANAVPSDQRHDHTTVPTLNGEQYGDTQHYTGGECAPGTSTALKLSSQAITGAVVTRVQVHQASQNLRTADEAVPVGNLETVGDSELFLQLETLGGQLVFQAGDSVRCGKSTMIFLAAICSGKSVKLLCVAAQKGSVAKMVPLRTYRKVASGTPTHLCQAALTSWIHTKTAEQQACASCRRQRQSFFEETESEMKP